MPKDFHSAQLHEIFPKLKSSRSVGPPYFNKLLDKDGQKCVRKRTFEIRTKRDELKVLVAAKIFQFKDMHENGELYQDGPTA